MTRSSKRASAASGRSPRRTEAERRDRARQPFERNVDSLEIQTVTGVLKASAVGKALAHEHMFVDFHKPNDPAYMNVNWSNKIGAAVESASVLKDQGVDLVVDWTNIGVGRNAIALRSVANQSRVSFVCPTGIYKDFVPPALRDLSCLQLADHFIDELASGIDGTGIRAGFVKIAGTESGILPSEAKVIRAAAIAARETGAALGFHGPRLDSTQTALRIVARETFPLDRFIWAHAQVSTLKQSLPLADRGVMLQFDAIGAHVDQFFHGPVDDDTMLERIEAMISKGFEDQIMLSTDASVCVNPPSSQYDRHNAYLYRFFEDKLIKRIGKPHTRKLLRDNVIHAFRRPTALD